MPDPFAMIYKWCREKDRRATENSHSVIDSGLAYALHKRNKSGA